MGLIRALSLLAACCSPAPAHAQEQVHHRGVDHLDRAVGPVRAPAAGLREGDRHRGARGRGRHRPGARHRPARRRRRAVRARQAARGEVRRRRLRREALRRHVQRLRAGRPEDRPGQRRRHARTSSPRCSKIAAAQAPFVSRGDKSGTHAAELELWKAAGIDIAKDKGPWYRETGSGMGPALNTAAGDERLHAHRPRHLALLQEPRRPRDRWSKATSACSTSTA